MENKKILVVFYSRTGTTRTVAKLISERLKAVSEEIIDKKKRSGAVGYVTASLDALGRKCAEISECSEDPGDYDLVIIGTPVWGSTMSSAVRTYLKRYKERINQAAFLITYKMFGVENTARNMEMNLGKKPVAVIDFKAGKTSEKELFEKIKPLEQ